MIEHAVPVAFALLLWWASTGAIIYADGLPERTFHWTFLTATVLACLALGIIVETRDATTAGGAYLAFSAGLVTWAWLELAFYLGYVTGPRKTACPPTCRGLLHFWHAIETVLWNQIANIGVAALIVWLTWGGENLTAVWTFAVLWLMQQSAKLNVYLGVRNLNTHFLPSHLSHLKAFMSQRPMNLFFPVSVSLATVAFVLILDQAHSADLSDGASVGLGLIATLLALAILEHWFLVLPVPAERLWDWSMASHRDQHGRPSNDGRLAHWTTELTGPCDRGELRSVLETAARGGFGDIERLDGLAIADAGWVTFSVRQGAATIASVVPAERTPVAHATANGPTLDAERLRAALQSCVTTDWMTPQSNTGGRLEPVAPLGGVANEI